MNIHCVYVDLDGVLADFRRQYLDMFGIDPETDRHKKLNHWDAFIEAKGFEKLPLMPDALEGIAYLNTLDIPVKILSSTGNEEKYDELSKQKTIWLKEHGIDWPAVFVPGKRHKQEYASKHEILIDDTLKTIEQWNERGGVGIYHTDWATTLTILMIYT